MADQNEIAAPGPCPGWQMFSASAGLPAPDPDFRRSDGERHEVCVNVGSAGGGPGGHAFAETLVLGIALELRRHAGSPGKGSLRDGGGARSSRRLPSITAQRVVDVIEARVGEGARAARLSIDELAREAGLSPSLFFRAFKATLGVDARLADVALAAGFADQSHFTRHFRRHYGVTPGRVQAAGRQRSSRRRR